MVTGTDNLAFDIRFILFVFGLPGTAPRLDTHTIFQDFVLRHGTCLRTPRTTLLPSYPVLPFSPGLPNPDYLPPPFNSPQQPKQNPKRASHTTKPTKKIV
jgi:hypothetical protein